MSLPGLAELVIVLLSFSIVGAYLFVVRQFLKNAEEASSKPQTEGTEERGGAGQWAVHGEQYAGPGSGPN